MAEELLPSEIVAEVTEFLQSNCLERVEEILREHAEFKHYGCEIDVSELSSVAPFVGMALLRKPIEVLPCIDEAIQAVQSSLCEEMEEADSQHLSLKKNTHTRLHSLPAESKHLKRNVSILRSKDVNTLISVNVTITRVGSVMIREVTREYECVRCKHRFVVEGDMSARGSFLLPVTCPSDSKKKCTSSNFRQAEEDVGECHDYQEVKAQEKVGSLEVGCVPGSILIVLGDDLVDCCKPGDDAMITGIVRQRWNRTPVAGSRCDLELLIEAVGVRLRNEEKGSLSLPPTYSKDLQKFWKNFTSRPLEGRNHIIRSICPEVYGMYLVKLIIAMTIIGGVMRDETCGTRVRGESHLLIVGDPGTGKSQLLKYAATLCPRAVLTTGIGTTSAGLTVTAVRDQATGEWSLDAGALVLADGGLCCIDEFGSIRDQDRVSIHEAMEQQTLSVAKAGLVCTLDTKTTVFGVTNPSAGRVASNIAARPEDTDDNNAVYLNLAAPLLSRFDVVLTLMDPKNNQAWDEQLSSFILNGRGSGEAESSESPLELPLWNSEDLKKYFYFVKSALKPQLSTSARLLLGRYYEAERSAMGRNAARTTVRLLESLIRLTQAHARLMCRSKAVVQDSVFAIAAVEASAVNPSVLGGRSGTLHGFTPDDAEADYRNFADYLLVKLGLKEEIDPLEGYDTPVFDTEDAESSEGDEDDATTTKLGFFTRGSKVPTSPHDRASNDLCVPSSQAEVAHSFQDSDIPSSSREHNFEVRTEPGPKPGPEPGPEPEVEEDVDEEEIYAFAQQGSEEEQEETSSLPPQSREKEESRGVEKAGRENRERRTSNENGHASNRTACKTTKELSVSPPKISESRDTNKENSTSAPNANSSTVVKEVRKRPRGAELLAKFARVHPSKTVKEDVPASQSKGQTSREAPFGESHQDVVAAPASPSQQTDKPEEPALPALNNGEEEATSQQPQIAPANDDPWKVLSAGDADFSEDLWND